MNRRPAGALTLSSHKTILQTRKDPQDIREPKRRNSLKYCGNCANVERALERHMWRTRGHLRAGAPVCGWGRRGLRSGGRSASGGARCRSRLTLSFFRRRKRRLFHHPKQQHTLPRKYYVWMLYIIFNCTRLSFLSNFAIRCIFK